MPWTDSDLPFAPSPDPLAAHCSRLGAEAATDRASTQTMRLLELYAKCGPLADFEAATRLGLERSSINARRKPLCDRGIVVAVDTVKHPTTGIRNTTWGLARC